MENEHGWLIWGAIILGIAIPYMMTNDSLTRFVISIVIVIVYIGIVIILNKKSKPHEQKQNLLISILMVLMTVGFFGLIHFYRGYSEHKAQNNYIKFRCKPSGLTTERPYDDGYIEAKLYTCVIRGREVELTYQELINY